MDKWTIEFLEKLHDERTDYKSMIDFCCDSLVLNNDIQKELEQAGFYFDTYCGDYCTYYNAKGEEITREEFDRLEDLGEDCEEYFDDIYQQFIINDTDAERLSKYTNELVLYCERLDLYLLCVKHFGTMWSGVSANWKDISEMTSGEDDEE